MTLVTSDSISRRNCPISITMTIELTLHLVTSARFVIATKSELFT